MKFNILHIYNGDASNYRIFLTTEITIQENFTQNSVTFFNRISFKLFSCLKGITNERYISLYCENIIKNIPQLLRCYLINFDSQCLVTFCTQAKIGERERRLYHYKLSKVDHNIEQPQPHSFDICIAKFSLVRFGIYDRVYFGQGFYLSLPYRLDQVVELLYPVVLLVKGRSRFFLLLNDAPLFCFSGGKGLIFPKVVQSREEHIRLALSSPCDTRFE